MSCGKFVVTNAYDHKKKIFLTTGENLYCENHIFRNEEILQREAIVVEYDGIHEAMDVIRRAKEIKELKSDFEDENY